MMSERGVDVDHSTIYRGVQVYAPEIEKRFAGNGEELITKVVGGLMRLI